MVEPISIIGVAVGFLKEIAILEKLKGRLQQRSGDPALSQISDSLTSMISFYNVIERELRQLVHLSLSNEIDIENTKDFLRSHVKSGVLYDQLRRGLLRCENIKKIWEGGDQEKKIIPLEKWFSKLKNDRIINDNEYFSVEKLIHDASDSEGNLVYFVDGINTYANDEADKILTFLQSKDIENAKIELKKFIREIDDFANQLTSNSGQLQKLGTEFLKTREQRSPRKNQSIWQKLVLTIQRLRQKL